MSEELKPKPEPNLIQRIIRYLRPESNDFQDAVKEDIDRDRESAEQDFLELLHASRRARRAADAFVVAAELFVKDVQHSGGKSAKVSARRKSPK